MEVKIESLKNYNMSNWEATHTFDTLNTGNNKVNILKYISEYLNNNGEENSIFIFSASFKISSSYSRYFNTGNQLSLNNLDDLQNITYMGKIIPFEYNEDLANIQHLLDEYKSLNYMLDNFKNHNIKRKKFVSRDLIKYLKMLSQNTMNQVLENMFDDYKDKIEKYYKIQQYPNEEFYTKTMQKLSQKHSNIDNRYRKYIHTSTVTTNKTFMNNFYNFSRPIIGIYEKTTNTIKIINSDQMFEKGKNCNDNLGLISITRNSPIKITVNATGIMKNIFNYLILSENDTFTLADNTTFNNDADLIEKTFNSSNSNINNLAKKVLNKIKEVTKSSKVSIQKMTNDN
ncbi:hypothetical protein [Clostridium ihumii]|uniref:hypothetical protein n=1 Tax=Clostridium ihumii TaxID=1470356 RepID=UPI00058E92CA|nr:hypothetical protein [Clostridium ihumii]